MADPATIDSLAGRLANIESGGRYDAQGPVTSKGDRAYGKYQVMGANIPSWTREATGVEATPDAFLADPDLQERTVRHRLGKYYDEYGNARDVASLWHSGVPYDRAVAEGRKDQLGTSTADYANRAAGGGEPLIIELPDGREIDMGVNPSAELQAQVRAKILADFPDLAKQAPATTPTAPAPTAAPQETPPAPTPVPTDQLDVASPMSTEQSFDVAAAPSPTVAFPSPAPAPGAGAGAMMGTAIATDTAQRPYREQSPDAVAVEINEALKPLLGTERGSAVGRYSAMVGKPVYDALHDIFAGGETPFGKLPGEGGAFTGASPAGGDMNDPSTLLDAGQRALKLLKPLAVAPEIAGNLTNEILLDLGANPAVAGALATIISLGVGAKAPFPGLEQAPVPRMPLQGTTTTRAAAEETARLAAQADDAARAAQGLAGDAERAAADAAEQVVPSPALRARTEGVLNPSGTTPTGGSVAVTQELGR
ncbi:MAG TPA: hypothetical protein VFQ55_00110, partial [Casimicrobiaceae bacterium]|nr:hypothetical protein [Casimicrobiaceae bacterium]